MEIAFLIVLLLCIAIGWLLVHVLPIVIFLVCGVKICNWINDWWDENERRKQQNARMLWEIRNRLDQR